MRAKKLNNYESGGKLPLDNLLAFTVTFVTFNMHRTVNLGFSIFLIYFLNVHIFSPAFHLLSSWVCVLLSEKEQTRIRDRP